jgi:hypothetical protein
MHHCIIVFVYVNGTVVYVYSIGPVLRSRNYRAVEPMGVQCARADDPTVQHHL